MGEFSVVDFGCDGQQFKTSDLIFSRADDPRSHMFRSDPPLCSAMQEGRSEGLEKCTGVKKRLLGQELEGRVR